MSLLPNLTIGYDVRDSWNSEIIGFDEAWDFYVHYNRRPNITTPTFVTGPDKTGLIALFCISRNTNFNIQCTVLLWWLDTVTPDILYDKCSYIAIIS